MSKSPGPIRRLLALSISVVSTGMLLLPLAGAGTEWFIIPGIALGIMILGATIYFKEYLLIHLSLFFVLLFGWKHSPWWPDELPTGLLIPFFSYLLLAFSIPSLRKSIPWLHRGLVGGRPLYAGLLIILVSLPALWAWTVYSENVIEYYVYLFHPRILYIELVIFALLFAAINSVTQEVIFRGVYQNALDEALSNERYAIVVQAIIFGLIHNVGVPSGPAGIGMAFIYGCMLGILKSMSCGLLLPVAVHFVTDLFIFFLAFYKAWLLGLLDRFPLL
ncbi:MAG TPA: CPBP family intramembrane glutamic endopeptidase [Anseongella sp.]